MRKVGTSDRNFVTHTAAEMPEGNFEMEIERKETMEKGRDDLTRYLDEIVDPTIIDLENNRTSVRHTFLACVAVFHAIDRLSWEST